MPWNRQVSFSLIADQGTNRTSKVPKLGPTGVGRRGRDDGAGVERHAIGSPSSSSSNGERRIEVGSEEEPDWTAGSIAGVGWDSVGGGVQEGIEIGPKSKSTAFCLPFAFSLSSGFSTPRFASDVGRLAPGVGSVVGALGAMGTGSTALPLPLAEDDGRDGGGGATMSPEEDSSFFKDHNFNPVGATAGAGSAENLPVGEGGDEEGDEGRPDSDAFFGFFTSSVSSSDIGGSAIIVSVLSQTLGRGERTRDL